VIFIRLTLESFGFAIQALRSTPLRTTLSLLGVSVGIFAIIAVFTLVDSLERGIRDSMAFLGDKVIYVQKWPWTFGPDYPWWKYMNRPTPTLNEFRYLERTLEKHKGIAIFASKGNATLKFQNNSVNNVTIQGVSYDYNLISDVRLATGRYFSQQEAENGRNVAIVGFSIAENLFHRHDPIGQVIKIKGNKFSIIGVMEKQGENLLGAPSNDQNFIIPYSAFTKLYLVGGMRGLQPIIGVKGNENDNQLQTIEGELRGAMRSVRGLKPIEDDSFALNRPEMIANQITSIFGVIGVAGWVIGSFSILVGGFGIANIMFVSVKERTNIIGIQKSLGAKNYFILFQFLFEAVFLSFLGGAAGIALVYLLTFIPQDRLDIILSFQNIMLGFGVSALVGILSGIIPAAVAARLDPVIAIRSK
jgi:putative ABC transport system permease protein